MSIDLLERCRIVKKKKKVFEEVLVSVRKPEEKCEVLYDLKYVLISNPFYPCNLIFTEEIRAVNCSRGVSDYARLYVYIIILRIYLIRMSRLKTAKL